jgi:hypothetical protein
LHSVDETLTVKLILDVGWNFQIQVRCY